MGTLVFTASSPQTKWHLAPLSSLFWCLLELLGPPSRAATVATCPSTTTSSTTGRRPSAAPPATSSSARTRRRKCAWTSPRWFVTSTRTHCKVVEEPAQGGGCEGGYKNF